MDTLTWLGLTAAACTTSSYVPQVLKSWRSRKVKDLSLGMYSLLTFGIALWLIYGFLKKDTALIAANSISLLLSSSVLYLKIRTPQ
ncbi:MAG: SemiSWEET transporter [Elusimicrobia bacterium]|nr:SemiSWEET transporter [Elusimicrobiota bacterium]